MSAPDAVPGIPDERHPGQRIAAARRAQSLTIPVLADALKIAPGVIEAIEAGEFERFDNPTFLRGYVRAIARRLHLPADELVAELRQHLDPRREVVPKVLPNSPPLSEHGLLGRQAGVLLALLTAGALVLVAGGVWLVLPRGTPAPAEVDNVFADLIERRERVERAERSLPVPRPGPERRLLPGSPPDDADAGRIVSLPEEEPGIPEGAGAGPTAEGPIPGGAGAAPEPAPVAEVPGDALPEASGGDAAPGTVTDSLTLRFSGECWTEIRDATDRNVFFDLGRPGEVAEVSGVPPFRVLLGNAPAVELAYNGHEVALSAFTRRDNTANLVIGQ